MFSTVSWPRSGLATITLGFAEPGAPWLALADGAGADVPFLAEGVRRHPDGTLAEATITFRADDVPALGYRTYWAGAAPGPGQEGWSGGRSSGQHPVIQNQAFLVEADPARGGALTRILDRRTGAELLRGPGNELVLHDEYGSHPRWGEGPWLLCPRRGPAPAPPTRPPRCGWSGAPSVPGWSPGSPWAGCGSARRPSCGTGRTGWSSAPMWTARSARTGCCGCASPLTCRARCRCTSAPPPSWAARSAPPTPTWRNMPSPSTIRHTNGSASARPRAWSTGGHAWPIGVAEVIVPAQDMPGACREAVRGLVAALAGQGVTATCTRADGPRYGASTSTRTSPTAGSRSAGPAPTPGPQRLLAALGPAPKLARLLAAGRPRGLGAGRAPARAGVRAGRRRAGRTGPAGADRHRARPGGGGHRAGRRSGRPGRHRGRPGRRRGRLPGPAAGRLTAWRC